MRFASIMQCFLVVFSFFGQKHVFSSRKMRIGLRLINKRRHFENRFLAGNDHVIDIVTSEDMKNISPCICRYLPVYYMIRDLYMLTIFRSKSSTIPKYTQMLVK